MTAKTGYVGIATYPNTTLKSLNSIYCASDLENGEVIIIPLTIGCFHDIYSLITEIAVSCRRVRIVPLSMEFDYVSDIYNSVTVMKRKYPEMDIRWIFPRAVPLYSEEFEVLQINSSAYHNEADPSLYIEFVETDVEELFDLKIYTPEVTKYFTMRCTQEKYDTIKNDNSINELHICGNESRHGGLCAIDLVEDNPKLRIFNLSNRDSLLYLRSKFFIGIDCERWLL